MNGIIRQEIKMPAWLDTGQMIKVLGGTSMTNSISGIYQIRNKINGHCYIGSAMNIRKRWREHARALNNNVHHSQYLQRAWLRYGADAFEFSILKTCFVFALIWEEQKWIDKLKPEYNVAPKAGSNLGFKFSAEQRTRLSEAHKNPTPEIRQAMADRGKGSKWTAEQRVKFIASNKGHAVSEETRKKISIGNAGKPKSVKHRASLSAAKKGKPRDLTPEQRAKIGERFKGNTYGKAGKGRKVSQEFRDKMSAIKTAYYAALRKLKDDNG
jgi:group I intron endonuclease